MPARSPSRHASASRALLAAVGWLWLVAAAALPAILRYLNIL